MNYSIGVWGFDTDNDYYHDCDIIKAKNISEAFSYACNVLWRGWTFTRLDIEELKEYTYIVNIMIIILMKMIFSLVKLTQLLNQK